MQVTVLSRSEQSAEAIERQLEPFVTRSPTWIAMYGVEDSPFERVLGVLQRRFANVPVFGATSFGGVFTSTGFVRSICLLFGEPDDAIKLAVSQQPADPSLARAAAIRACHQVKTQLGMRPDLLLLHATPGFEERILDGINQVFSRTVPVFGGSAADDRLSGAMRVFSHAGSLKEGFVLAGLTSSRQLQGAFMGGFLPTDHRGAITKAEGRVVFEINGCRAAELYNEWTLGAIEKQLRWGGSVVRCTNLWPLARVVGSAHDRQRRILSHPHEVLLPDRALRFFSEFTRGDQITLMTSTVEPLISRVNRTVERARGPRPRRPHGALLVYCAGSLSTMVGQADRIGRSFAHAVGGAPFLGIATAGEQGAFFANSESWHCNLMCSTVLL